MKLRYGIGTEIYCCWMREEEETDSCGVTVKVGERRERERERERERVFLKVKKASLR